MNTEKIEKLKKGLTNSQIPETLREKIREQIKKMEAEDLKSSASKSVEISNQEKIIQKEMVKEKGEEKKPTERAKKTTSKPSRTKNPKHTVMSVAKEIRKDGESWADAQKRARAEMNRSKTDTKKEVRTEMKKLLAFIKNRKELKGIYDTDLPRDAVRHALPKGKRISKDGNVYYENRDKHSDRLAPNYPKNAPLLELGGGVDGYNLAGQLDGNFNVGQNDGNLSGISGTNYTGLVGETGAMSAGEMFANGGSFETPYNVIYRTKSGRTMVASRIMAKSEEEASEKLKEQMRASKTFDRVVMAHESFEQGGSLVDGYLTDPTFGDFQNQVFEGGGDTGLPAGADQSYVNHYLGEGAYAERGTRLKSALMRDRNNFNHSQKHEVRYSKDKPHRHGYGNLRFDDGGGVYKMPEWSVTIESEDGDSFDWVGFAKNEDEALYKAEKEADFESVESGITLITDKEGNKIEYAEGGGIKYLYFKNEIENGYIDKINNYYNQWFSIKNEKDSENFKKIKPPMFGTYDDKDVLEQINHFEKLDVPFQANEVNRNQFKKEVSKIIDEFIFRSKKQYELGGDTGLPAGADQSYVNHYLGEGAYAKGGMVVTSIKDIPNFEKRLNERKITYRGLGTGKIYDDFYKLSGTTGTRIKVDGKEYFITDNEFDSFSRDSNGKLRVKFEAPQRKYAEGGSLEGHGIQIGDTFLKTISGNIQKVKDKNGNIVYINLSNGERDSQPPLPFKKGGDVTFADKSNAIAKKLEGTKVAPKYQKEYGKTYNSNEAKEAGNKIAGSIVNKSKRGNGEIMLLAKKIRKTDEAWKDALKRAGEMQKNK